MPSTDRARAWTLPPFGENPSSRREGTTPGSFALPPRVGTPCSFSSPDMPGMPGVSEKTAMDWRDVARDREGKTQLEEAGSGTINDEMRRVARREPHLSAEQVRAEVGAGRMIIPANKVHLKYKLDP